MESPRHPMRVILTQLRTCEILEATSMHQMFYTKISILILIILEITCQGTEIHIGGLYPLYSAHPGRYLLVDTSMLAVANIRQSVSVLPGYDMTLHVLDTKVGSLSHHFRVMLWSFLWL